MKHRNPLLSSSLVAATNNKRHTDRHGRIHLCHVNGKTFCGARAPDATRAIYVTGPLRAGELAKVFHAMKRHCLRCGRVLSRCP